MLPVPGSHNPDGQGGIAVSWTTHNLLALDWGRGREQQGTQQAMNRALASVLKALGYQVRPFGTGGATLVTGPRSLRARRRLPGPGRQGDADERRRPGYPDLRPQSLSSAWRASPRTCRYWHAYEVVRAHGESGVTARLEPATIDGLVYASSMVVLYAARHQLAVPALARWLLAMGIVATLAANVAHGWPNGPIGAAVAAWPAASLVGSYELLLWLVRTAATSATAREPTADQQGEPADHLVRELRLAADAGRGESGA